MKKKVLLHFQSVDPRLFSLYQTIPLEEITPRLPRDYFASLCREIIGQQLASRVAHVLFDRFTKLFPRRRITPKVVLTYSEERLRATGMAWSKTRFIRILAQKVVDGKVNLPKLEKMSNDEITRRLIKIKGIGPWTIEMFLIFTLGREDVFSLGDLGLQKAIQKLYKLKRRPTSKQLERISQKWSPYRTYAARILWQSLEL